MGQDSFDLFWADVGAKTKELYVAAYGELPAKYDSIFFPKRMKAELDKLRADIKAAISTELPSGGGRVAASALTRVLADPSRSFSTLHTRAGSKDKDEDARAAELRKIVVDYAVKHTSFFLNRLVNYQDWSGSIDDDRDDGDAGGAAETDGESPTAAAASAAAAGTPAATRKRATATPTGSGSTVGSDEGVRKRRAAVPPVRGLWQSGQYEVHHVTDAPLSPPTDLIETVASAIACISATSPDLEQAGDTLELAIESSEVLEVRALLRELMQLLLGFTKPQALAAMALYKGLALAGGTLKGFVDECRALKPTEVRPAIRSLGQ